MASTYFHGAPEVQTDGLQTLYLMNPGFAGGGVAYADAAAPTAAAANMLLLNSPMNSVLNPISHPHHQHFVSLPFQPPPPPPPEGTLPMLQYNSWPAAERTLPMLQYNSWPATAAASNGSVEIASQFGGRGAAQQGLSLRLSPHEMAAAAVAEMTPVSDGEVKFASAASFLGGSKYLRAAQQLLDEVVSVGKGIKEEPPAKAKKPAPDAKAKGGGGAEESANLTTAEKHELQMKKAKFANMLEEVEQRYRQYRHQIQIVVSSFESIAGVGSARTYTAVALRTISKRFRCLRDAIAGQIWAASKTLGEEADAKTAGSRLRFIDQHFRQQRALQQLGMMQQNAWRSQRGLPERSVSILRAWLFEHFLHPYPKDSDKSMLAKQAGLTRSQVSNWFINARVRLWKPMVEKMYLQETKDNNGDETPSKSDTSKSMAQLESGLRDEDAIAEPPTKKGTSLQANATACVGTKRDEASSRELLMQEFMDGRSGGGGHGGCGGGSGFGLCPIGELAEQFAPRFAGNGGGVSLTLGLQHSDSLSIPGAPSSFQPSESIWAGGWR